MNNRALAKQAVIAAGQLRHQYGIPLMQSLCPYNLAHNLQISVRFASIPSLEGMYSPAPTPTIIIGSQRPTGRKAYTCAHEIGHHIFGHGYSLDEIDGSQGNNSNEYIAQRFASALLMPELLVRSIFKAQGWDFKSCNPEEFYLVAQEIGVGYDSLITNMSLTTRLISRGEQRNLGRHLPKDIRCRLLGRKAEGNVFLVHPKYSRPNIDVEVGDFLLTRSINTVNSHLLESVPGRDDLYIAISPGEDHFTDELTFKSRLRVSKKEFVGIAIYRYLEDPEFER